MKGTSLVSNRVIFKNRLISYNVRGGGGGGGGGGQILFHLLCWWQNTCRPLSYEWHNYSA